MVRSRFGVPAVVTVTLTLLAFAGSASVAYATEWFVAPGGTGSGTSAAPFGQIQTALQAAQPGDVITVQPGTYSMSVATVRDGTASSPITLRAATRGTVLVTWSGNVLSLYHAYHIVDGFVFDGQYGNDRTVKVGSNATSSILRRTEVRRSWRDCVSLASPVNFLIEDSLIHHCLNSTGGRSDAHGISAEAAQNLTIRRTEIHSFSGDGIQVDPARLAPGWDQLTIDGCKIWLAPLTEAAAGFPAGAVTGENAVDTKIYTGGPRARLLIRNTEAWGFRNGMLVNMAAFNLKENLDAVLDGVTVWDSEIAFRLRAPAWVTVKNAVVHDVGYGVRYEDNIPQLHVWNTTFGSGVGRPFYPASSNMSGLDVSNVLVLGSSLPAEASGATNRTVASAAFVNAAIHNYHLAPGSTAIDAGASIVNVLTDHDNVPRPQGAHYDVGAYEYCSTSGCGATPASPPPVCAFSISPGTSAIAATGGTGTVTVTTSSECGWTASSPVAWVTLAALAQPTGPRGVNYSVAANTATASRSATLTIAGQNFTVTQAGASPTPPPPAPCAFSISPGTSSVAAAGGTGTVMVTTTSVCGWTASSPVAWVTLAALAQPTGSRGVNYSVAANTSTASRSATLTIAGQSFAVTQAGASPTPDPSKCVFTLSPESATVSASGGTSRTQVSAQNGGGGTCTWTTTNVPSWVRVLAGSGSGNGQASFQVDANPNRRQRSATLAVAGHSFTLTQSGRGR